LTLDLSNVSVSAGRRMILDAVSFSVAPGEVLGIVGPNGAGKTTLLRVLTGELVPRPGSAKLGGRELRSQSVAELARQRAYLPQQSSLDFGFSVLEVVLLGRTPHRARESQRMSLDISERAMALCSVSELGARPYLELSGGEQQRVQLARVLAQIWEPSDAARLLLLDEPTASLDLSHQHTTLESVRRFAESGVAVVVVLHDLALAAQYTDRLLLLAGGRVLDQGKTGDVLTPANVSRAFGVQSHEITIDAAGLRLIVASGVNADISAGASAASGAKGAARANGATGTQPPSSAPSSGKTARAAHVRSDPGDPPC